MAARSRAVITPSLSCALAFQMRTLPSSDPVITNRASAENIDEETLRRYYSMCWDSEKNIPLHPFRVVHLWAMTLPFLPNPYCSVPPAAHEFQAGRTPVAAHDGGNMCFVNMAGCPKMPDIKCIQVMIF